MLATGLLCACEVAAETGNPPEQDLVVLTIVAVPLGVDETANRPQRQKHSQSLLDLHTTLLLAMIGMASKTTLKLPT